MNGMVIHAVCGGVLVGLASGIVLLTHGRVAGVSGMVSSVVRPVPGETGWRAAFLFGLALGGVVLTRFYPDSAPAQQALAPLPMILAAGLLVGFGARMAGGCTSGNGLCGFALRRTSPIAATAVFTLAAMLVVLISHQS